MLRLNVMEVHLTPEQQAFIEESVRQGRFASSDDAVRQAVTLLKSRELELAETRAFVRQGIEDLDAGRYEEYTDEALHEMFDDIKSRGLQRLAAERPPKH
jgi:antitoxin ParD1/3/4